MPGPGGAGDASTAGQGANGAAANSHQERLPRAKRITGSRDIRTLFQRGKRSRTAHLDVFDSASPLAFCRVGIVVPKHRRDVVERNRLKRRLREILRQAVLPRLETAGVAADVLVRARREAYEASFDDLSAELRDWVARRWSLER